MNLSKLFSKDNESTTTPVLSINAWGQDLTPPTNVNNPDNQLVGESYTNYGKRLCMKTAGAPMSLAACLQRIFASERQKMLNDKAAQDAHKASIQAQANAVDIDIATIKSDNKLLENQLQESNGKISEVESEIAILKTNEGEENKQAKVKFWIGASILSILTVYLFIFYSSTFYSAFIHTPTDLSDAMFDPQAIPNAFSKGIMSGLFLCTVPIIFLGLGFGLHYISQAKGAGKYIKSGALVIITLMFDCILAVAIAKSMYQIWAANQWQTPPLYSMSMAASDLHVWAVIFCGFIVYMIWAVVFDLTITAYIDIRSNESKITRQKQLLETEKHNAQNLKNKIVKNNGEIQKKEVEKNNILSQLSKAIINPSVIFNAFTQFYQGWIFMVNAAALGTNQAEECEQTYKTECKNLLNIDINNVAAAPMTNTNQTLLQK